MYVVESSGNVEWGGFCKCVCVYVRERGCELVFVYFEAPFVGNEEALGAHLWFSKQQRQRKALAQKDWSAKKFRESKMFCKTSSD